MTTQTESTLYYDPFSSEIRRDPYPTYRRLREEAPLYYNDRYDFFAVSRFADVEPVLLDRQTFSSSKGGILAFRDDDLRVPHFSGARPGQAGVGGEVRCRVEVPRTIVPRMGDADCA